MSMLQPFELEVLTKNDVFDDHELAKMPAEKLTRLARNYTENCMLNKKLIHMFRMLTFGPIQIESYVLTIWIFWACIRSCKKIYTRSKSKAWRMILMPRRNLKPRRNDN